MVKGRWLPWFAAALAVAALFACKKDPAPRATVSRVRLSPVGITHHPWLGFGPAELEERGRQALQATGAIALRREKGPEQPTDWKAFLEITHVRVVPPESGDAGTRAEVGVLWTLQREGERVRGDALGHHGFVPHDPQMRAEAFRRALDAALESAARLVALQLDAARKSEEELIADLEHPDPTIRDIAVRILTERKSRAAVRYLIDRLDDEDRNVQLRAIGALVEIGDPSAVPALIDATSQRDASFVVQVAYALGEFGDEDAEAFLFTASTGHPEPAVRRAATEALENLRKRRMEARR